MSHSALPNMGKTRRSSKLTEMSVFLERELNYLPILVPRAIKVKWRVLGAIHNTSPNFEKEKEINIY